MILVVNVCKEKLSEYEFVDSVTKIIKGGGQEYFVKGYGDIREADLRKCSVVIICGTALKDFGYLNHMEKFEWIKKFEKPILGICAGFQVMEKIFGGNILKKEEARIGMRKLKLKKKFLGFGDEVEAYFLHRMKIDEKKCVGEVVGVIEGEIVAMDYGEEKFGVIFHPEIRNSEMIKNFLKLC